MGEDWRWSRQTPLKKLDIVFIVVPQNERANGDFEVGKMHLRISVSKV